MEATIGTDKRRRSIAPRPAVEMIQYLRTSAMYAGREETTHTVPVVTFAASIEVTSNRSPWVSQIGVLASTGEKSARWSNPSLGTISRYPFTGAPTGKTVLDCSYELDPWEAGVRTHVVDPPVISLLSVLSKCPHNLALTQSLIEDHNTSYPLCSVCLAHEQLVV